MKYILIMTLLLACSSCQNDSSQRSTDVSQNLKKMIVIKGQGINKVLSSNLLTPERLFMLGENEYQLIYDEGTDLEDKAKELSDQGYHILEFRTIKVMNFQR